MSTTSGRGFGLDIVKTVLDGAGGQMAVHSETGRGTVFELRVPLTLALTRCLLVVEDSVTVREVERHFLEQAGYRVTTAVNGMEVTRQVLAMRAKRILICTATVRRNTRYLFDALKAGALSTLLAALPRGLAAAVLVSQHIEAEFTPGLADWLVRETGQPVVVARAGEVPRAGYVYVACGGRRNLLLLPGWRLGYEPSASAVYYPNIDRMLESIAAAAGRAACGVVLTGLGDDGAAGMARLSATGAKLLVQDPAAAAVDGMPGAVLRRGLLSHGHGLQDLARLIAGWAGGRS